MFDGCNRAQYAKLFDTLLYFAVAANTCSIEKLNWAFFKLYFCSVNIAGCASAVGNYSLLFFSERIKEIRFTHIWSPKQCNAQYVVFFLLDSLWNNFYKGIKELLDTTVLRRACKVYLFNTESLVVFWLCFGSFVGLVNNEKYGLFTLKCHFSDTTIFFGDRNVCFNYNPYNVGSSCGFCNLFLNGKFK